MKKQGSESSVSSPSLSGGLGNSLCRSPKSGELVWGLLALWGSVPGRGDGVGPLAAADSALSGVFLCLFDFVIVSGSQESNSWEGFI